MDWDAVGAIGEVIGAVAVVITLGYLAKQVQQQNRSNEGDAVRGAYTAWTSAIENCLRDQATSDMMMRGLEDFDSLNTVGERGVFHANMLALFNAHLTFSEMAVQGLVPKVQEEAIADQMAQILNSPGASNWWSQIGPMWITYDSIEARRKNVPPGEHPTFRLIRGYSV